MLAVLLGLAVLYLLASPTRGYRLDDKSRVQVEVVGDLLQRFRASRQRLPSNEEGLRALVQSGLATDANISDSWGQPMIYRCNDASCGSAKVYSTGPNQRDENGAGDDISVQVKAR